MDLPQTMDVNFAQRYSHIGEKLLHLTYDTLGVQFIVTLEVCGGCAQSKAKALVVRKKTYTQVKTGRNDFCGYGWSIPINYNWAWLLDWHSR